MPIQNSLFATPVNAVQNALTVNRDTEGKRTDGILKTSAKVVTRVPVNVSLTVLSAIETVVKAALTALSSILYPVTKRPLNYLKASTGDAARTTAEAFKGIAGYKTEVKEVKEVVESSLQDRAVEFAKDAFNTAYNYASTPNGIKIIGATSAVVLGLATAYVRRSYSA